MAQDRGKGGKMFTVNETGATSERQRIETNLRAVVGKYAAVGVSGRPPAMLVRVDEITATNEDWSALLTEMDRSEQFKIGPFPWNDNTFPMLVLRDYWHFPLLSERYSFNPSDVEALKRALDVKQKRIAAEIERDDSDGSVF